MIRNIINKLCTRQNLLLFSRHKTGTSAAVQEFDIDETENTIDDEEEQNRKEEEIMRKRNKSRLRQHHHNVLHNKLPYSEPVFDYQKTLSYQRKLFGKYGEQSGVDPRVCWPTPEEIEERKNYENIAYPYTIQQIMKENERKKQEFEAQRMKRQEDILKKYGKLEHWKKELRDRISKREEEARLVKDRKDRLIEEVRRHFGFKIDPRDDRFKEMLEQKEKAEKKKLKEEKRKVREQKMIEKLQTKNAETMDALNKEKDG